MRMMPEGAVHSPSSFIPVFLFVSKLERLSAKAGPALWCHSEEYCDEESDFDFRFLIEKIGERKSRCFTSFSMTR
jgi:hypothetical protein